MLKNLIHVHPPPPLNVIHIITLKPELVNPARQQMASLTKISSPQISLTRGRVTNDRVSGAKIAACVAGGSSVLGFWQEGQLQVHFSAPDLEF